MTMSKLVAKNLIRRKGRFVFTLLGITIGIASLVTLLSLGSGLHQEIAKHASDLGANLVVTPKGWCAYEQVSVLTGEQLPEAIPYEDAEKIIAIKGLTALPYLTERAVIQNNPVPVVGILPQEMKAFKKWELEKGEYFASSEEKAIVIGAGIAQQFEFKPGAVLTIRGEKFPVKGVLQEKGSKDDIAVFMPLTVTQRLYRTGNNVSFVAVKVDDIAKINDYILKIQETANVAVVSDKQLLASVLSIVGTVSLTLKLIAAVAVVAAAFGIINTMMTAIYERKREIGILQALGAKKGTIFKIFLLESGFYGILGGVVGTCLGLTASYLASPYISRSEFTAFLKGSEVALRLDLALVLEALLFSLAVSLISGLYPAWRAARLTPVEAISYE